MKKRLKMKKSIKFLVLLLVIILISSYVGINKYQEYKYQQTNEYKLLTIGYDKKDINLILDNDYNYFLNNEKDEKSLALLKEKYYIKDNFNKYQEYMNKNKYSLSEVITLINVNRDYSFYENIINTNIDKNDLILVNKYYKLSEDYSPENLVNISSKYSWGTEGTHKIKEEVYNSFINLWNDAYENANIYLMINSSYRTYQKQLEIYNKLDDFQGEKYADSIAARPGHSEHQTGLALDIFSKKDTNQKEFENSITYEWLKENSYKYGFIIRYPKDKDNITGYQFESWHYRYVGVEVATYIHQYNITFDEYYAFYLAN